MIPRLLPIAKTFVVVAVVALAAFPLWNRGSASAEEIYSAHSLYRDIYVYDDDGLRCMKFGRYADARQSCVQLDDRDHLVFNYTKMVMGALYLNPEPRHILIIGLGGGTLPMTLQKLVPSAQIDCVEIDPAVVDVAKRYFGFAPAATMRVVEEDGRVFVKHALHEQAQYDLIILDAFNSDYIPEHMLTREFLQEVRGVLASNGVLAANTFSSGHLYFNESATYASVFGPFFSLKPANRTGISNRVIVLSKAGLPDTATLAANARALSVSLRPLGVDGAWLLPMFDYREKWPDDTRILTDQYSPSNLLNGG